MPSQRSSRDDVNRSKSRMTGGGRQAQDPSGVLKIEDGRGPDRLRLRNLGWPVIKQKHDLKVQTIIGCQLCTIEGLLSKDECDRLIDFLSSEPVLPASRPRSTNSSSDGASTTSLRFETAQLGVPKKDEAFRLNDRISIDDPQFTQTLWSKTGLISTFERWLDDSQPSGHHPIQSSSSLSGSGSLVATNCWGLNPNLRIYRYRVGHRFESHFDESVLISTIDRPTLRESLSKSKSESITDPGRRTTTSSVDATSRATTTNTTTPHNRHPVVPNRLSTEFTLLIYLTGSDHPNSPSQPTRSSSSAQARAHRPSEPGGRSQPSLPARLEGGETVFYADSNRASSASTSSPRTKTRVADRFDPHHHLAPIVASIQPVAGLALIHRHGPDCLLHEARPVTAGVKYVLRSDIMFG